MAQNLDSEISEKYLAQRAGRDPSGGFAGAGPFQNVAGVGLIEFEGSGQIGMSGTRAGHPSFGSGFGRNRLSRHDFLPVRPVAVLDHHRDRAAQGLSMSDTRQKPNLILLDFHPAATAISSLPPLQFVVDEFKIQTNIGG